jgi:pimeloyl-ACP methyl ester carboxylesterase
VAGFVAVDAGPWVRLEGGRAIVDFVADADRADCLDALVEKALRFNPRRDPRLLAVSLRHNLRRLPDGRLTWKTDRRQPVDLVAIGERLAALQARVAEIRCQTLVLRGAESQVFLDEHAARFADALPAGRWKRIEGAGHTIQGDAPAALIREVAAFLGSL